MEVVSGDNWSYEIGKVPVRSWPPTYQHPLFTGGMPFLSPNQQCQNTGGKACRVMNGVIFAMSSVGGGCLLVIDNACVTYMLWRRRTCVAKQRIRSRRTAATWDGTTLPSATRQSTSSYTEERSDSLRHVFWSAFLFLDTFVTFAPAGALPVFVSISKWVSEWVWFNVPINTLQVISETSLSIQSLALVLTTYQNNQETEHAYNTIQHNAKSGPS